MTSAALNINHPRILSDPSYDVLQKRGRYLLSYIDDKDKDKYTRCSKKNVLIYTRAERSKSLIRWKRLKGGKGEFDLQLDFWQKKVPH